MAKGYLGKISAVVSANTADFDAKLGRSAKEVQTFASRVQSNLTSASRQAAKSLEGIYTPLQRFERSLQAAATMKLSFKGFPGMIKDIDALQQRLNSALSQRQVDIVLKTTGMKSITDVRDALYGLKSKDIEIITRVGGLEKLNELREQMRSDATVMEVRANVEQAKARVAEIGKQLADAKAAGGEIAVKVDDEKVQTLERRLAKATAAMDKLKATAASSSDVRAVDDLTRSIDQLNDKRAKLEAKALRVRGDERELQKVNAEIDKISSKVTSLEGKRAKLGVSTDEFKAEIADAQERVKRITASLEKAKAGGSVVDVQALQADLRAAEAEVAKTERKLSKTTMVKFGVDADLASLDEIAAKAEKASDVLGKLPVLMSKLGQSDFSAAADKMRQVQSVAEGITKPLESAATSLGGLSKEMQAAYKPAAESAQKSTEQLVAMIDRLGGSTDSLAGKSLDKYFEAVRNKADQTTASVERLKQVQASIGQSKTGGEFVFEQPRLNEAITRGADIGNRAAALPAETIAANPEIAKSLAEIRRLSDEAGVAYAKFLSLKDQRLSTTQAQADLDKVVKKLVEAQAVAEKQIAVSLDTAEADKKAAELKARLDALRTEVKFSVTGGFSSGGQIEAEVSRITADIQKLDATQKAAFGRRATLVIDLLGDNKIQDAAIEVKNLRSDLDQQMELKVTSDAAQKAVDALKAKMDQVREQNAFIITGRPQNMEQAEGRETSLRGEVGELKGSQRRKFKGLLEDAAVARESGDLAKYNDALDAIEAKLKKAKAYNVNFEKAKKEAADFKLLIDGLKESAAFQFTDVPQTQVQARGEIERIVGRAGGLDAAAIQRVTPAKDAAIAGLGNADFGAPLIKTFSDLVEKELQAKKAADDLKAAMDKIGDAANPSAPIDILKKNLAEARAAVAKLEGPMKAIGERNIAKIEAFVGANAGNEAAAVLAGQKAGQVRDQANAAAPVKPVANPLGADFGTAERQVATLQGSVQSLQGSLEKLPAPMQAQFIPAINKVRASFQSLTTSSTQKEIDAVVKKAAGLELALARAGQASKIGQTLGESLNSAAIGKVEKQIGFIRSKLLEVGASASGPVADAFNKYATAASNAAKSGTAGLPAVQRQLDVLIDKLVKAAVATGTLDAKQAQAFKKSIGDVGRGGADKFALALNQAAFAVDDFLSSTGGLEFKLRAVSNNITQLAFILGGTTGLFVGLGAVIAGQAAVGLIKWYNNGRTAEDQTKALNDALARQKSLVEELAEAFRSLGDSMSRGTFSAGGEQAAEFSRQMEDIRKKQDESIRNSVADFDPAVIRERAEQRKLQRKIEKSEDVGEIVGFQTQLEESKRRERSAADAANAAMPPDLDAVQQQIKASFKAIGDAAAATAASRSPTRPLDAARNAAAPFRAREAAVERPESTSDAAEQIRNRIRELSTQVEGGLMAPAEEAAAKEQIKALSLTLGSLAAPLLREIDKAANELAEASRGPATQIRQAQEDVAEAIRKGVPNAAAFQRELDANAKKLKSAYSALEDAQKEKDPTKKQAKVDEAKKNIAEVEAEQNNIRNRSREVRLGRTFGGDRTTAALSSLEGNERFRNESARTNSYLAASIDRELEARKQLEAATAKGGEAEIKAAEAALEAAQKASEAAAAFAEAAIAIEAALTRIRKVGESALQKSEQGADAAQKAFEENPRRGGGLEAREDAERRFIDDKARVASAQDDLDNRRREIQSNPQMKEINDELEAITQRRKDLEAKGSTGLKLDPAEQKELDAARKREVELMRQREHLARDLTAAERQQLDAINNGIAAREKELEKSRQLAAEDPAFKRVLDDSSQIIAESERQADEAQQRYINNPTAQNFMDRVDADLNLVQDRQRARKLQDDLDNKRKELENDPAVVANNKAIAANDERLAALAEKEATVGLTDLEKQERGSKQEKNRKLRSENESLIRTEILPKQLEIEEQRTAQNQRDRAMRGRDLGMTDRERFRKEFAEGAGADINARAKELARAKQLGNEGQDPAAFLRQAISNQMEQVAPMLQQFQEERQNALLQGPSRAALNVSDVSTTQGQSELNRLLRGDDAAKDVNLVELQKQTQKFDDLIEAVKAANPGVLL